MMIAPSFLDDAFFAVLLVVSALRCVDSERQALEDVVTPLSVLPAT